MSKTSMPSELTPRHTSPLARAAASGFAWMVGRTLGTKVLNTGGQIVLAWLLDPKDFGLIGLAYTVTALISVLQQAGLQEILIHRHAQFKRWANPVFWMSACLGIGGTLLTWAAIPLAARVYHAPQLGGLLLILSANAILGSLTVVPQSKLSNGLRFRALAAIGVIAAACNITLACLLAWAGWGAYAIAIGSVGGTAANVVLLWNIAPHWPRYGMQVRRWKYLVGDSTAILITSLLMVVLGQGDYMVLGIFETAAITGLYYFAFNLSMQTITLFTINLTGVLFPALSKLQADSVRQTQAFIRAARVLALVAVPICLAQAAVADPVIRLIFPAKWYGAIPIVQILCLGMAWRAVGTPANALMQSQGRFRTLLKLSIAYVTSYLLLITSGVILGGMIGLAAAEAFFFALLGVTHIYVGIRSGQGTALDVARIYIPAVAASVLSLSPGVVVAYCIHSVRASSLIQIAVILLTGIPLYLLIIRRIAPRDWRELSGRIRGFMLKRGKAVFEATTP